LPLPAEREWLLPLPLPPDVMVVGGWLAFCKDMARSKVAFERYSMGAAQQSSTTNTTNKTNNIVKIDDDDDNDGRELWQQRQQQPNP
jgi:hypothetical protein